MKTEKEWQAIEREIRQMGRKLKALRERVAIYEVARKKLNEELERTLQ